MCYALRNPEEAIIYSRSGKSSIRKEPFDLQREFPRLTALYGSMLYGPSITPEQPDLVDASKLELLFEDE